MITSGSCRNKVRKAAENVIPIFDCTWNWLIRGKWYSMGSSTVQTLFSIELISFSAA